MNPTFNEQAEASIALIDKRSAAIERVNPSGDALMTLIEKLSTNESLDVVKAEKMVELYLSGQRRMREMQDEREYYERMADFKRNPPEVIKRLTAKIKGKNNEYSFEIPYADMNAYADAAMGDLAERGITWDFEVIDLPPKLTVTCLMHYGLYTRRGSTITGEPTALQSPNSFMQKGAAQSFLSRYTFCASTGLTAAMPPDKNATSLTPRQVEEAFLMEEGKVADFLALIEGAGSTDELWDNYERACMAAGMKKDKDGKLIPASETDPSALDKFTTMRRKRAGQLEKRK